MKSLNHITLSVRVILSIILAIFITACGGGGGGGGDDSDSDSTYSALSGTWKSICLTEDSGGPNNTDYSTSTLTFNEGIVAIEFTLYESSSCEVSINTSNFEVEYVIGEQSTTNSGDTVTNIDMNSLENEETTLDIFKIEQGYLYFGEKQDNNVRPEVINYTFWFVKQ